MMDNSFRYAGIIKSDIANGLGVGITFFTQGCSHKCDNCHNPETWNPDGGKVFTDAVYQDIISYVKNNIYINHLTLSGGEPFESVNLCNLLIDGCKDVRPDLTIWCYTGYTFEEIIKTPEMCGLLNNIDVLVDGLFVQELRDTTLAFRGSSNQRVIDVKKSLKSNVVILYDKVKQ